MRSSFHRPHILWWAWVSLHLFLSRWTRNAEAFGSYLRVSSLVSSFPDSYISSSDLLCLKVICSPYYLRFISLSEFPSSAVIFEEQWLKLFPQCLLVKDPAAQHTLRKHRLHTITYHLKALELSLSLFLEHPFSSIPHKQPGKDNGGRTYLQLELWVSLRP